MKDKYPNNNIINSQIIKKKAKNLGFDFCGIAPASKLTKEKYLFEKWLSMKCQGKMSYLEKNSELRFNPSLLLNNAKSVISLALNYYPKKKQNPKTRYKLSKYAYGKDYHLIIKEKLSALLKYIREKTGNADGRAFVDSAPVMEKLWAKKAGLGWIGKNCCFIIPQHGSYFFLCELIVDIELQYDNPFEKNYCGNCTLCIDNCPTQAISEEGFVNAKKCISYLTIEMKDPVDKISNPPELKNWIFGCDICQDICPWNRFAKPENKNLFQLNETILDYNDNKWENFTMEQYLAVKKSGSPISRIKYEKLKNNIEYVKNSKSV